MELNKLAQLKQHKVTETESSNLSKTNLTVAQCMRCGDLRMLYLCEQGHGKVFCRDCLVGTTKTEFGNGCSSVEFIAKCNRLGDCNFNPI